MGVVEWLMGWLRDHMRSWRERPTPREGPRCQFSRRAVEMQTACEEFVSTEIEPLERAWAKLESRGDFRSDHEREALRPKLVAAYAERDSLLMVSHALRESAALAAELRALHDVKETALVSTLATMTGRLEIPDAVTVRQLFLDSRELDSLRQVLCIATGEARFSRAFDAVDRLRKHWEMQSVARQRIFTHYLSPGHRPAMAAPTWAATAARLKALSEATRRVTPLREHVKEPA